MEWTNSKTDASEGSSARRGVQKLDHAWHMRDRSKTYILKVWKAGEQGVGMVFPCGHDAEILVTGLAAEELDLKIAKGGSTFVQQRKSLLGRKGPCKIRRTSGCFRQAKCGE